MASAPQPPNVTPLEPLPALDHRGSSASGIKEKDDSLYGDEKASPDIDSEKLTYNVSGEPIITTGEDVSNHLVDVFDIGGDALTFRSIVLGSLMSAFGASITQIYLFKPLSVSVSSIFLLLVIYTAGRFWERLPTRETFARVPALARIAHWVNPGPFGMKEHAVATFIASTASSGSTAVNNFGVQRLFYDANPNAVTAVLATFSTACFGYGLVGLLRPLLVYPSHIVFWASLPNVSIFQTLHHNISEEQEELTRKRIRLFWIGVAGMAVYEIFPAYMFPLLNGISIFCLSTQHVNIGARTFISRLFGGANSNEGLGLLQFSFDWQYLGSWYMSLPLIQQVNTWVGMIVGYVALLGLYYSNTWSAKTFPFMSTSIFDGNGTVYDQEFVFGDTFTLNETAYNIIGQPYLTSSNVWNNMGQSWAIGGLFAHVVLPEELRGTPDIHYEAMKKYKEAPSWWYASLLVLSFFAGLIVILKGNTTLPWWGYFVALITGSLVAPFSTVLYGRMGNGIATNQLFKMIAGAIHPGKPVANLYVRCDKRRIHAQADVVRSSRCGVMTVVSSMVGLAGDLKLGQYLKIPPRVMFLTQVYGTILGAIINYVVMQVITENKREILIDPIGDNQWSGIYYQSLNSNAVTWSLAGRVYGINTMYRWVPLGILLGTIPVIIQWLISRRWRKIGIINLSKVILPYTMGNVGLLSVGINSTVWSSLVLSFISQYWLRLYHPRWFKKYNFLIGGAFDGGSQITLFILTFAVFGASGVTRPFPYWWGNREKGNVDYCYNPRKGI
ncbi:peptide transporter MTD1 [Auriculariales sp. MPI-PUGE-AT-0066]|nr:peptide transporter MTD1 [Auriculariales sp. MPI-PUGE-AT-0066]